MVRTVANRDLPYVVRNAPPVEVNGYGALSYTPTGHGSGYLPSRLVDLYCSARSRPMIYSYGTPIAWFQDGKWIVPAVTYSATTAKHQSYVRRSLDYVLIPADCSATLLARLISGADVYHRDGRLTSPSATNPAFAS